MRFRFRHLCNLATFPLLALGIFFLAIPKASASGELAKCQAEIIKFGVNVGHNYFCVTAPDQLVLWWVSYDYYDDDYVHWENESTEHITSYEDSWLIETPYYYNHHYMWNGYVWVDQGDYFLYDWEGFDYDIDGMILTNASFDEGTEPGESTQLQYRIMYYSQNGQWGEVGEGALGETFVQSATEEIFPGTTLYSNPDFTTYFDQVSSELDDVVLTGGDYTDDGGLPWRFEIISDITTDRGELNELNIAGRANEQPTDSLRIFTLDYGWSDPDGVPTNTPTFNPEGGTNPFYYNFDGMGCNYGILTAKQINVVLDAETYNFDWTNPTYQKEYTVYPEEGEESDFHGVFLVDVFPYIDPQRPYFHVSASCYRDDERVRRDDTDGEYNGGEAVFGPVVDNPCDDMVLTDPDTWLTCLIYRINTQVFKPLFTSSENITQLWTDKKNELATKFPFIYAVGGVTQINYVMDAFDVERGSAPTLTLKQPFGDDVYVTFDQLEDPIWYFYTFAQFFAIVGTLIFVLVQSGLVGESGQTSFDDL